jgi:2-iminobutanoate/2-iminopropanoate deaminase
MSAHDARRFINPGIADDPATRPFSGAVLAGDTLYLSGHLGVTAATQTQPTVEAEAVTLLDGLSATLRAAGMSMDDLVYVQIFVPEVSDYDAFNAVYRTMFTRELPARAFIGSGPLLFGARFEIQGIAVKR